MIYANCCFSILKKYLPPPGGDELSKCRLFAVVFVVLAVGSVAQLPPVIVDGLQLDGQM
jgi:hypothetical protein